MSDSDLYGDDIRLWSERQGAFRIAAMFPQPTNPDQTSDKANDNGQEQPRRCSRRAVPSSIELGAGGWPKYPAESNV